MAGYFDMSARVEDLGVPYARRVATMLGISKRFPHNKQSSVAVHDVIDAGLPRRALLRARQSVAAIPIISLLPVFGISERTYMRIQAEPNRLLDADQSGRLWRFAELFAKAEDVFGSSELAVEWMMKPAIALENRTPIELLKTSVGAQLVDDVIERIHFGVYQ
jgi:putative toxin-antitoxin system antitoxin component (TIGR02293 family)